MKSTSTLKRKSTLKNYAPLRAGIDSRTGHMTLSVRSGLKKSSPIKKQSNSLQKQLDDIFSEYVRRLHADANGAVQCVTCGIYRRWNDRMDAGHFIIRKHMATRYDIYNVFPQCKECNRELNGNIGRFTEYLIRCFGKNIVEELKEKEKIILYRYPYKEKMEEFRFKLSQLKVEQSNEIQY